MKTVCIVVKGLEAGGIENYLLRFLQYKHTEFNTVYVFCRGGKTGILEEQYKKIPNVTIIPRRISYVNPLDFIKFYFFLKKTKVESVCDFTSNIAGPIMLIAKIAGIKTRITQYRVASDRFKPGFFRNSYNKAAKKMVEVYATKIISNSIAALDYFFPKRNPQDPKFEVIYNGIDTNSFIFSRENLRKDFGIPQTAFVIGNTSRYNEVKNHLTILKVARQLCSRDPDVYFILCGNLVKDNLEREVDPDLRSRIILLNARTDVIKVLNTMDCFYFPTLMEGQPNALIEAMAAGLPFVTSNIPPVLETIPPSALGQCIEPMDWAGACEKLLEIKNNPELRKTLNFSDYVKTSFNHRILFQRFFDNL